MSSSHFSKDTVLQLSVGKLNGGQNKYPNYKSNIIRWVSIEYYIHFLNNYIFGRYLPNKL